MSGPGRPLALDIEGTIGSMAEAVPGQFGPGVALEDVAVVGIRTGGVWVAEALRRALGHRGPVGSLDIAFYRDDFSRVGLHPQVAPSQLPFPVDDARILLVDDILYTGRTVRAAMNELFDYGRPALIRLAVLIDRGGRELPIQPDVCGHRIELAPNEQVKLTGPEPLALERFAVGG